MKKILSSVIFLMLVVLTGCVKNELTTYTAGAKVEWDASTWNANAAGITYPMLVRVPVPGIVTPSSQPTISRTTGALALRVNLVGAQRSTDTEFAYQVSASESTAVAGTHYTAVSGKGTIAANSSFGTVTVNILNPGPGTGTVDLVLQLIDNANLGASVNYSKVGIRIAQN
jgi:hypothetical protein